MSKDNLKFYALYGKTTEKELRDGISQGMDIVLTVPGDEDVTIDLSTLGQNKSWLRLVFNGVTATYVFDSSSGWSTVVNPPEDYIKPASGIPKTALASAVQTSLDKADSALQSVPNTYRTASAQNEIDGAQDAAIYAALAGKQDVLTAGDGIVLENGVISATAAEPADISLAEIANIIDSD